MTDKRLQQLKRAWETSGSTEDQAAYLRERVRAGVLSPERLETAALIGHPAAQLAMDCAESFPTERLSHESVFKLARSGLDHPIRLGLFLLEIALERFEGEIAREHAELLGGGLSVFRDCLENPSAKNRGKVRASLPDGASAFQEYFATPSGRDVEQPTFPLLDSFGHLGCGLSQAIDFSPLEDDRGLKDLSFESAMEVFSPDDTDHWIFRAAAAAASSVVTLMKLPGLQTPRARELLHARLLAE